MGIFTGLLTLPLAPVRGTVWIAEKLAEEAERQLHDDAGLRRQLMQLELERDDGLIDEEQYGRQADALVEAIARARTHDATPIAADIAWS